MSFLNIFNTIQNTAMMPFWCVVIFIFGLCVGSFINVCIWRIPRKESVTLTPSHCPKCGKRIKWYENIPVVSWLVLRGKCSGCSEKISVQYLLIELITAFLFVISYIRIMTLHYPISMLIPYLLASSMFIVTFVIDYKFKIIPNKITYAVIIISLCVGTVFPESVNRLTHFSGFLNSFLGFLVSLCIFWAISIIGKMVYKRDAFGLGDVKFLAALGACFGLFPAVWFFVIIVASFLGVLFGILLIVFKKKKLTHEIPFGPFLSAAGCVWIIYGPEITVYYFKLNYILIHYI
ncbi:MAG TPA: prepilin peptidase [Victivallales bacterium]|nr:prepilin peptidase [Victivallales bacterium]